jgi:GT2 family glycosyltransferase
MSRVAPRSPSVNVVIVNWNGKKHLVECLPSLQATGYSNFHVTVVDNGSTDDSLPWLRATYSEVEVIALGRNMGFATANNIGIRRALKYRVEYVALLNNDTRVESDWLDPLVSVVEADASVALCQSRQRTWDGQQEIRFRFIPAWAEAEQKRLPVVPADEPRETPFVSGCAMLLRSDALRVIGLFDERYFMYVEDVDLTLRAWIAGYRAMDVPASVVYHRMMGSNSSDNQRMAWGYRNQLTTLLKLYEPVTLRKLAGPIGKRWLITTNRVALRGTLAAVPMLTGTLHRRRKVQRMRRAPDTAFVDLSTA